MLVSVLAAHDRRSEDRVCRCEARGDREGGEEVEARDEGVDEGAGDEPAMSFILYVGGDPEKRSRRRPGRWKARRRGVDQRQHNVALARNATKWAKGAGKPKGEERR